MEKLKTLREKAGFTLVELIVVIAILGILSGVGVVGYSGYIEKAHQANDLQTISDVKYAMELAAAAKANETPSGIVVLNGQGNKAISDSRGWAASAVDSSFGTGTANTEALKMTSKKYSNIKGVAVAQQALQHFQTVTDPDLKSVFNGTYAPSFANDVDDLFGTIRDTAIMVNGGVKGESGAALIQGAAGMTMNSGMTAAQFGKAWRQAEWQNDLMGTDHKGSYNPDSINKDTSADLMAEAVANAGVLKARNTAFACFLRNNGHPELYDLFANSTMEGSSIIPDDAIAKMQKGDPTMAAAIDSIYADKGYSQEQIKNIKDSVGALVDDYFGENLEPLPGTPVKYPLSQAEKDGMAYYAMMNTIQNVNADSKDDASYWDEMSGAVSAYGSIARGETTLEEMKSAYDSAVAANGVVVQMLPKGGKLTAVASTDNSMKK